MVDNVAITAGSGTTIAADDIGGGVLVQRAKVTWGPDGTSNDADVATGKPLPVQLRSSTGLVPIGEPTDAKSTATDTTSVTGISIWKQISASVQALVTAILPTGWGVASTAGRFISAPNGFSARVSVTRPSNTTTYAAGDVVGVTGGGTACITFANMGFGAGDVLITSLRFQRNATDLISGEAGYKLHLFNVTQPGAQVDNAVFDVASGDQASYLGFITIPTPTDLGSTLHSQYDGINKQVTLASTSLFGVLTTDGGYQPVSAAVHVIELHSVSV